MVKKKRKVVLPEKAGYTNEFLLDRASVPSIWNQISTSRGLSEWFAMKVDITGDLLEVFWDDNGDDRVATIVTREPNQVIKWIWNDDPKSYLRMEIVSTELSHTISLLVDDHDMSMEHDSLEDLWANHMERLRICLGLA